MLRVSILVVCVLVSAGLIYLNQANESPTVSSNTDEAVSRVSETVSQPKLENQNSVPAENTDIRSTVIENPKQGSTESDDHEELAQKVHDELQTQYQAEIAGLRQRIGKLESKEEQLALFMEENPVGKFITKHLALAEKHRGTSAAKDSLLFVFGVSKGERKNEAMMKLLEGYSSELNLKKMARSFKSEVPSEAIEQWYLKMIETASTDEEKASVMYDYAKYLSQFGVFRKTLEINPQVAAKLPKEQLDYINRPRTAAEEESIAAILRTLMSEFGSIKKGRDTYGALAKKELFDLEHLQVGDEAPDIVGRDLDGVEFRLSDYRGKVVLLDFWGHWCGPCRAMYPAEQRMNIKLADKPFVLLGVNSDRSLEFAREAVESEGLSWRHFWNGPNGTQGPISEQWNVEGWPTFYLIDADGIIRYKQVSGQEIELGIEKLMAEIGEEVKLVNAE